MPIEFKLSYPNMNRFFSALPETPIRDWTEAWPESVKLLQEKMQA